MAARAGRSQTLNLSSRLGASNESKTKYGGDGVNYKARFVGSEDVMDSTGSKIAQTAIGRIRAECRAAGGGKPKVLINLSYNGVKVADLKTKIWSISVPIPRVTYVTKDTEDPCVFCIIVARKKAGFKLFVYKAEQRITAQIVQSIRELFQIVYKMVQKKKKTDEAKSKSATTLPKTNSDVAIARITSDSKLLDPPPQYEEEMDPAYSMVDFPPPQKNHISEIHRSQVSEVSKSQTLPLPKNQDGTKSKPQMDDNMVDLLTTQPPSQQQNNYDDDNVYAVPWAKKKSSVVIPYGYQVPTSNQPALPSNHYQVPSNRPAFPDSTDANKEWSVLDAELAEIAKELNMFGDISSTPEQPPKQQQRKSHRQSSVVNPFQDDFFDQPFDPLQDELVSFDQTDDSITFESSDPFSSPDLSALSDNIGDTNDDPFTALEFGNPTNGKLRSDNHKETAAVDEQPSESTEIPPIPPDPFGVRLSLDQPPDKSKTSPSNPGLQATTDKTDNMVVRRSWTTFNSTESPSKTKKRLSMFEESVSAKQSTNSRLSNASNEQIVSPIKPPPRNRRKSSRPHTIYGEQNIKTDPQPQQSTPKKPLFDLASIKPKIVRQEDSTSVDPFMDLFMRKPQGSLANVPTNNNSLEYTSTYL